MAAAIAACCAMASQAHAASATGTATVRILQAITVTKTSDLNFGKVVAASQAATVSIGESGARTCGTGLTCYGATTAGAFGVTGSAGETVSVSIDNPSIQLTNGGGAPGMTVALTTSTPSLVLSGGGGSFKIAGTLTVGANQPGGVYSGYYSVSVNYQ